MTTIFIHRCTGLRTRDRDPVAENSNSISVLIGHPGLNEPPHEITLFDLPLPVAHMLADCLHACEAWAKADAAPATPRLTRVAYLIDRDSHVAYFPTRTDAAAWEIAMRDALPGRFFAYSILSPAPSPRPVQRAAVITPDGATIQLDMTHWEALLLALDVGSDTGSLPDGDPVAICLDRIRALLLTPAPAPAPIVAVEAAE
jgi:hypothetical protein